MRGIFIFVFLLSMVFVGCKSEKIDSRLDHSFRMPLAILNKKISIGDNIGYGYTDKSKKFKKKLMSVVDGNYTLDFGDGLKFKMEDRTVFELYEEIIKTERVMHNGDFTSSSATEVVPIRDSNGIIINVKERIWFCNGTYSMASEMFMKMIESLGKGQKVSTGIPLAQPADKKP